MKKGLVVGTVILTLMIMTTLLSAAQNVTDYFYGELDQWPQVEGNTVQLRSGKVLSLKASQTDRALYLNAKMPEPADIGTFYLETEREGYGYAGGSLWRDNPTIHYKIENGTLYNYLGTGFDEDWEEVGDVETILLSEDLVIRVDFDLLGFSAPQPLKVAYRNDSLDILPADGAPMLRVSRRIFGDEDSVRTQAFWDGRTTAADNVEKEFRLAAVKDHQKLFVLVEGYDLNARNTYYLETEGPLAYTHPKWEGAKITHKVDAGILYEYTRVDGVEHWRKIGPVYTYISGEAIVMAVDLHLLGATETSSLKLGFSNAQGLLMPGDPQLLPITASIKQPIRENTFYPLEYHGVLNNPYKGWAPNSEGGPYNQPHRLVRTQMLWSDIEPERGVFDWEGFEAKNNFEYWDSIGVSYIIRFRMDVPSRRDRGTRMQIPQWLFDMIDGDGVFYDNDDIGKGFSPDYENPIMIAEHERFLKAFGERYNNDPRVAFIQLGSVGHWGEWHTWPEGSGKFPREEVANQYIQHYVDNFDQKLLGIRRPLEHAVKNNFGFFNDRIGNTDTTDQWLFWINNGMDYDDWYNWESYPERAVPDFWKTTYSAGEFGSGNALLWLMDDTVAETLRLVRLSHTSWIGPCSPAGLRNIPEITNVETLLKTIGYRFVVESVTHKPQAAAGQEFSVEMVWNNKGIAPFYFPWPLEVSLADANGEIVLAEVTSQDIRQWLPGRHTVNLSLEIPHELAAGDYTLLVSINDPVSGEPGVDLAITGRRADGRYELSTFKVK